MSLLPSSLKYIYVHHPRYAHSPICIKLNIRKSPTLIQYHVIHYSLLPLLNFKFSLQQWESCLPPSTIHLFVGPLNTCFRIVNLYSHEKQPYQLEHIVKVQFLLYLALQCLSKTPVSKVTWSHAFLSLTLSVRLCETTCDTEIPMSKSAFTKEYTPTYTLIFGFNLYTFLT